MQIIGPDGTPIESAEQLAQAQAHVAAAAAHAQAQQALAAGNLPTLPAGAPPQHTNTPGARQPAAPVSNRAPSTTIDALEREFQKKKQRELEQARSVGASSAASNGNAPRVTGTKVGRNDPCPCGSGKKYKKCHGAEV
jgi:preprotein translocase subunit SecA